ncbi:androgen-induced gene 1 family protein [Paracoccaceae bacterium]|nr:androgen-induced gene 1 family protein [Paracoccaceae bacterium]
MKKENKIWHYNTRQRNLLYFRGICFTSAMLYWFYQFYVANYNGFGIQFRYLTIWGLTGSLIVTGLLFMQTLSKQKENYFAVVSSVCVLNALVVFLYWRLYFVDPELVNYSGSIIWFQEYYLHLLGPLLLFVDSILLNRSFRQFKTGIILTLLISFSYVAWTEIVTTPLNNTPVGSKAAGLPYPFLNDMVLADRLIFYAISIVTGVFFYFLFWIIDRVCLSYFWGLSK